MGAWGYRPFENDSALDAVFVTRAFIEKRLQKSLRLHESDEYSLGYVEQLIRLGIGPSSSEFGEKVETGILAEFNRIVPLHRRIGSSRPNKGRIGECWNDPEKRLRIIKATLRKWRAL